MRITSKFADVQNFERKQHTNIFMYFFTTDNFKRGSMNVFITKQTCEK